MAISARDRKLLWSLSGNQCARCGEALVQEPEDTEDVHAVVGRECHIVARSPVGPRGHQGPRFDIDAYENLILLCANCHAVVDARPDRFPPAELQRMKREHEAKVRQRATRSTREMRVRGRDQPVRLERMESGDALLQVVARSFSFVYELPDRVTARQRELLGPFLEGCKDWGEIYDDIGPSGHLDAGQHLQDELDSLREEGLVVYATTRLLTLEANGQESPWPEAVVKVVHARDALIKEAAAVA